MTIAKTISLDVNNLDLDADGTKDHVTFRVTQTDDQSFSVQTFVDTSKDSFGKLNSDTTKLFSIDTPPNWQLSSLRFERNKLILLGQDGTRESLSLSQLIPGTNDEVTMQQQQQLATVLGALRDDSTLDSALGSTGLNADMMNGIGGLIGSRGTKIGSSGLGGSGSQLSGDAPADGLGGLGTAGRGTGSSGYTGGGTFGVHGDDGLSGSGFIVYGGDKALVDAVIKRNMQAIRHAYQSELTAHPDLAGKVTIKFVIAKDGTVSSAEVRKDEGGNEISSWNDTEAGAKVNSRLCARFMSFQFPEPKGGGIVITSYPFVFSPG